MEERDRSIRSAFQAGCIGGVISTIAFQPLDVIRTRLQAQMLSGNKNPGLRAVVRSVYHGTTQAGLASPYNTSLTIGLPRFWTGTVASLWRCVPGIGGYFFFLSMLENLVRRYKGVLTGGSQCVQNFLTGFCARSFVAVALSPLLVAKTQIESGRFVDRSLWGTLCRVHRSTSWRGLYSGVCATIARDGPYSGLYFMTYSYVKGTLLPKSNDDGKHRVVMNCVEDHGGRPFGCTGPCPPVKVGTIDVIFHVPHSIAVCTSSFTHMPGFFENYRFFWIGFIEMHAEFLTKNKPYTCMMDPETTQS